MHQFWGYSQSKTAKHLLLEIEGSNYEIDMYASICLNVVELKETINSLNKYVNPKI
jgi:hypothetical protein